MKILKRKNFNVRTYVRTSNPLERLRCCNLHFYIILRHSRTFQSSSFSFSSPFSLSLLLLLSSITSDFRNVVIRSCRIYIYVSDRRLNDYAKVQNSEYMKSRTKSRCTWTCLRKKTKSLTLDRKYQWWWIQKRQRLIVHVKHEQSRVERKNLRERERTLTYNCCCTVRKILINMRNLHIEFVE